MFWISVITGIAVAAAMLRYKKLYSVWAVLFNILVSIYAGVMLTPTVMRIIPELKNADYNYPLPAILISFIVFALLQFVTSNFLTGRLEVTFPKIIDRPATGIASFFCGYITVHFFYFLLSVSPAAEAPVVGDFLKTPDNSISKRTVSGVCEAVSALSMQTFDNSPIAVNYLVLKTDDPNELLPSEER